MYGEIVGILTTISFALSFVLARRIQDEATPIFQNTVRALVGFITFLIICLSFGVILTVSQLPILIILMLMMSILFTVILGDTAYLQSQKVLGPAKALAVGNTTPFFTILFSTIFLGRPFTILMIFSGILIGIGAYIINIKNSSKNDVKKNTTRSLTKTKSGLLWAFFASISWAVGLALSEYSIGQTNQILGLGILSTVVAMLIRFLFASVVLVSISLIEQRKKPIPKSRSTWKFLILSALLSYSLGSIFFGEAVYIVGASFMALISTAMPLFTIPFSYFINKEKLSKKGFIGVILTILGVILILI